MTEPLNVVIVGCGLIGQKRAASLGAHRLVACVDPSLERAEHLARQYPDCQPARDMQAAIDDPRVDLVIVATSNDALAPSGLAAIEAGHHVLIEKPAARTATELAPLVAKAEERGIIGKVGFNHRFHPAMQRAHEIVQAGGVGDLMFIRGRYGHGGRLGYEKEWRANPAVAGGGELLDQGVHLIDLVRWFAGDIVRVDGHVATYFWPMDVEDNAFMSLRSAAGVTSWLHTSWTEWKNLFSFEIMGRTGKLQIDGLGGSYGTERLTYYRMLPEMGPPETTAWEYPGPDRSWDLELAHLVDCIRTGTQPSGSLADGLAVLRVVERVYAGAWQ